MSESEEFLGLTEKRKPSKKSAVPITTKLILVFLAWVIALLLVSYPEAPYVKIFLLFPIGGIAAGFSLIGIKNIYIVTFLGWIIYITITVQTISMKKIKGFCIYLVILVILLLLNTVGCREML